MSRSTDPKKDRRNEEHRRWIDGLVSSAQQRNWHGKIEIHFKKGQVDKVLTEESLKPPYSNS